MLSMDQKMTERTNSEDLYPQNTGRQLGYPADGEKDY